MGRFNKLITLFVAVLIVFGLYQLLKPRDNDRDYLLSLPSHVAELTEKRQAAAIRRFISKDYLDPQNRSYQDLSTLITAAILLNKEIAVGVSGEEVELDMKRKPPHATLSFNASFNRGATYHFILQLEKNDDGWMVDSGEWAEQ